ncbi:MAG: hypothetical protein IPH36_04080 [Saprospiraceae bacterium]|nr:hypothetical protein [Saprospiraceae bacterium]
MKFDLMNQFLSGIDNRETALIIWASIVIIWLLSINDQRANIFDILKNLFASKLTYVFALITGYTGLIYYILHRVNFWEIGLLKEGLICLVTIGLWGVGTAVSKVKTLEQSLKSMAMDSIKVVILIQFLTGFYVMSLPLELIIIPIAFILGGLQAVSSWKEETDSKFSLTTKLFNWMISILGLGILGYIIKQFINRPDELLIMLNLKELILPIIMTVTYIPLLYLIGIYTSYESFFPRLKYLLRNKSFISYAKIKIFLKCNLNIDTLNKVQKELVIKDIYTIEELNRLLKRYRKAKINGIVQ